jgi:hypothetical protein
MMMHTVRIEQACKGERIDDPALVERETHCSQVGSIECAKIMADDNEGANKFLEKMYGLFRFYRFILSLGYFGGDEIAPDHQINTNLRSKRPF